MDHAQIEAHLRDWVAKNGGKSNEFCGVSCGKTLSEGPFIQFDTYIHEGRVYFTAESPTKTDYFALSPAQRTKLVQAFEEIAAVHTLKVRHTEMFNAYAIDDVCSVEVLMECICVFTTAVGTEYGEVEFMGW